MTKTEWMAKSWDEVTLPPSQYDPDRPLSWVPRDSLGVMDKIFNQPGWKRAMRMGGNSHVEWMDPPPLDSDFWPSKKAVREEYEKFQAEHLPEREERYKAGLPQQNWWEVKGRPTAENPEVNEELEDVLQKVRASTSYADGTAPEHEHPFEEAPYWWANMVDQFPMHIYEWEQMYEIACEAAEESSFLWREAKPVAELQELVDPWKAAQAAWETAVFSIDRYDDARDLSLEARRNVAAAARATVKAISVASSISESFDRFMYKLHPDYQTKSLDSKRRVRCWHHGVWDFAANQWEKMANQIDPESPEPFELPEGVSMGGRYGPYPQRHMIEENIRIQNKFLEDNPPESNKRNVFADLGDKPWVPYFAPELADMPTESPDVIDARVIEATGEKIPAAAAGGEQEKNEKDSGLYAQNAPDAISIRASALIGLFVGSAVAFSMFHFWHGAPTVNDEPLLAARN